MVDPDANADKALGILMARAGSKRIPGKNTRLFAGRPIFLRPLESLLGSGLFDRVIVSTDDPEVMALARVAGAEIPFVRPGELSDDHATTFDVMRHAADFMATKEGRYGRVCCVYGTSVFLREEHLRGSLALLADADAVLAAVEFEHPVQRGFVITNGMADFPNRGAMNIRTQDWPKYYHDTGLLYWMTGRALADRRQGLHFSDFRVRALILARGESVDIDTPEDWVEAERRFSSRGFAAMGEREEENA